MDSETGSRCTSAELKLLGLIDVYVTVVKWTSCDRFLTFTHAQLFVSTSPNRLRAVGTLSTGIKSAVREKVTSFHSSSLGQKIH